ncbi:MAG: hypothetical protein KDB40_21835 [Acidimicrobiales bacterium]|nr:hypothetical protein [Acidimicrobiales bacterium]MCB9393053.1 hypothetical protein [Acidimicrobiaceae bacterium]
MATTIDPARRAALNTMRLLALLDDARAAPTERRVVLGGGAGVLADDGTAWVLLAELGDRGPDRQLGAALAFAVRHEASSLHVVAEQGAGVLARRAGWFSVPIRVSRLEGRTLAAADPDPLPEPATARPEHRSLAGLITAGGALAVEEHGVVAGEVDGLEVCRVVDDPITGEVRLEVGVGAHDRETFQLLHGDRPTVDALADVVRSVAGHRREGAAQHPLNQLAASRRLRARLLADPTPVGAAALVPVDPPLPRTNLKDEVPCVAAEPGTGTLVVCTSGVDLDVVPWAGDAIARHGADRCVIAAPARDVLDVQRRLAALLTVPTRFVGL